MGCSANALGLAGPNVGCDDLAIGSNVVGVFFFAMRIVDGIKQMDSCPFLWIEGAVFFQESETLVAWLFAPSGNDKVGMSSECVAEEYCVLLYGFGQGRYRLLSNGVVVHSGGREELRGTLLTFLVLTIERVGRRTVITYDCAERRSFRALVFEVDDLFGDLGAVQRISYFPHSGKARMILLWIDGAFEYGGHGRWRSAGSLNKRQRFEWEELEV
jgi:hypothetical protein